MVFFFFSWTQLYNVSKPVHILFQLNWTWSLWIRGWTSQSAFLSTAPKSVAQLKKIKNFIETSRGCGVYFNHHKHADDFYILISCGRSAVAKSVEHNNRMSLLKNSIKSTISVKLFFCLLFFPGEQCAHSLFYNIMCTTGNVGIKVLSCPDKVCHSLSHSLMVIFGGKPLQTLTWSHNYGG